jgi:hypothetical protein
MNFQPLFTTARVLTAVYRVASTTLLLIYLARRVRRGQTISRIDRRLGARDMRDG